MDFKKIISVVRSQGINCQIIIQGVAQLSDRYEHNQWEEIISACDTQIFLGCNDQMTAEYISKKCGKITIRVSTSSMPMQPLFSPIYNTTRPGSMGRQNTQRDLMLPDELRTLDNKKSIILVRGQKPLELYKISPLEMPDFNKLTSVRITDYTPEWRKAEEINFQAVARFNATLPQKEAMSEGVFSPDLTNEDKPRQTTFFNYSPNTEISETPDITTVPEKKGLLERYQPTTPDEIKKRNETL